MNETPHVLRAQKVAFEYRPSHPVLRGVDLTASAGRMICVLGPNGSGKTTLFHIIMGLLKPAVGRIEIFGKPVSAEKDYLQVRRRIGLLFQDADDQLFSPTVLEDVAFGPLNQGKTRDEAIAISRSTLSFLGLSGFEDRITFKLSGGEKRLVALATILAMEPEVLLLDEPSAGLDEATRARLVNVLKALNISYIIVSHELDFLKELADSVFTLQNGKIRLDTELQLHEHVHAHPYGKQPHKHESV